MGNTEEKAPMTTVQIYEIQEAEEAREMARLGVNTVGSVLTSRESWKQDSLAEVMAAAREEGLVSQPDSFVYGTGIDFGGS